MSDHFLLMASVLAVLLVGLQALASLNASQEITIAATDRTPTSAGRLIAPCLLMARKRTMPV